jgi:hypothetical protein
MFPDDVVVIRHNKKGLNKGINGYLKQRKKFIQSESQKEEISSKFSFIKECNLSKSSANT